jgi:hypothetical protein
MVMRGRCYAVAGCPRWTVGAPLVGLMRGVPALDVKSDGFPGWRFARWRDGREVRPGAGFPASGRRSMREFRSTEFLNFDCFERVRREVHRAYFVLIIRKVSELLPADAYRSLCLFDEPSQGFPVCFVHRSDKRFLPKYRPKIAQWDTSGGTKTWGVGTGVSFRQNVKSNNCRHNIDAAEGGPVTNEFPRAGTQNRSKRPVRHLFPPDRVRSRRFGSGPCKATAPAKIALDFITPWI